MQYSQHYPPNKFGVVGWLCGNEVTALMWLSAHVATFPLIIWNKRRWNERLKKETKATELIVKIRNPANYL